MQMISAVTICAASGTHVCVVPLSLTYNRALPSSSSHPIPPLPRSLPQQLSVRSSSRARAPPPELADGGNGAAGAVPGPEAVVQALYEAIRSGDAATLQQLLAPDLEWWFHGPPEHQHLKRLLTGEEERDPDSAFEFDPQEVAAFGATVVAEGFRGAVVWVHAWTVGADGVITQVREYSNTSLTVTRLCAAAASGRAANCVSVWQSRLHERARKSFPGLVLAI